METSVHHEIKVGLFALAGLILFCLSIILLGGDKWFLTRTYDLKVRLPQVQGLGRGSVVTLTGVQIGNVDKIEFIDGTSEVQVTLNIEAAVQNRITEGSKASVKTQGALGDKYIFIEPGPAGAPPLKPGALLDIDRTPDLLDMIASKGAELGEIVEVIKDVHTLFESINKDGRGARLIKNLVDDSDQFGQLMTEARETFKLLRTDTIQPLSSVMKKIDRGQGTLGALVNDPSLHNRLTGFLGQAPRNRFLKPLIRESIQTNEKSGQSGH
jgi:phospholipid/cholesterol/gamma-HCH transport system substrate-binding protein